MGLRGPNLGPEQTEEKAMDSNMNVAGFSEVGQDELENVNGGMNCAIGTGGGGLRDWPPPPRREFCCCGTLTNMP
jgi:hypothetical protein